MDPATPGQYGGYQPPPPPGGGGGAGIAMAKVAGPAIGLIVVAGIGICLQILGIFAKLLGMGFAAAAAQEQNMPMASLFMGPIGIALGFLGILVGVLIIVGALKMKKLESYGLAMTVSILAMIPCISPCCVIGLPIGIWALVVLMDPNVKGAFH